MNLAKIVVALIIPLSFSGCTRQQATQDVSNFVASIPPEQIVKTISMAVPPMMKGILDKAAKKSPTATKQAALNLKVFIDSDVAPLIKNGNLPAATLLPQIETLLLSKLDASYETGIAAVLAITSSQINFAAPAMSDNEKSYILAAIGGISNGCSAFLNGAK